MVPNCLQQLPMPGECVERYIVGITQTSSLQLCTSETRMYFVTSSSLRHWSNLGSSPSDELYAIRIAVDDELTN